MTATEYKALRLSETWLRFPEWQRLKKVYQNKVRRWGKRKLMARRAAVLLGRPIDQWPDPIETK